MYWFIRIFGIASFSIGIVALICIGICLIAMLARRRLELGNNSIKAWLIVILSALAASLIGCICMRHAGIGTDESIYLTPGDLYAAGISVLVSALVIPSVLQRVCAGEKAEGKEKEREKNHEY